MSMKTIPLAGVLRVKIGPGRIASKKQLGLILMIFKDNVKPGPQPATCFYIFDCLIAH